jgi:hypothetical protein
LKQGDIQEPIPTRSVSEGFWGRTVRTRNRNPSLTFRVGIVANAQLQKASARDPRGTMFKTRKRNPSLTFRVVMSENAQLQNSRCGLGCFAPESRQPF